MTINETLACLNSAQVKLEIISSHEDNTTEFTAEECQAVIAAIDIAAGVFEFFKARERL